METLTKNSLFINTKILAIANGTRSGYCILADNTKIVITRKNEDEIIQFVRDGKAIVIYSR